MKKTSGDSIKVTHSLFQEGDGGAIPTSPLQLQLEIIPKRLASECYKKWHYLGDTGFMSTYNFGVKTNGNLWGCISFGCVNSPELNGYWTKDTQDGWWEIKRLALSDCLPKNSESRVIAIGIKLLKKARKVKGIVTYADDGAGHVGTIYKASGFKYLGLTAKKTDLYINGKKAGKKGQYRRAILEEKEEWKERSRKHLFIKTVIHNFKAEDEPTDKA